MVRSSVIILRAVGNCRKILGREVTLLHLWASLVVQLVENSLSVDRGAWRVTVHGVTKSWTGLSD